MNASMPARRSRRRSRRLTNSSGGGRTRLNRNRTRRTGNNGSRRASGNRSGSRNRRTNGSGANRTRCRRANEIRRRRRNRDRGRNQRRTIVGLDSRIRFGRRFLHDDGRSHRRVIKEDVGHCRRHADTAVRGGIGRDVTLVHGVAAAEKHRIWHARAIVVGAGGPGILPRVDIRFNDITEIIHVIPKHRRDVIFVLRENLIGAWRSRKPFLAGRNR
jgi:hypothetical protein